MSKRIILSVYRTLALVNKEIQNHIFGYFNNIKNMDMPLLFRWFIINDKVAQLYDGVYIVDSIHGHDRMLTGYFTEMIHSGIKTKIETKYPPAYCTLHPKHGNFHSTNGSELFIVIPIGNYSALQSLLASDMIDFTQMQLIQNLEYINKPYHAKAMIHAINDFSCRHYSIENLHEFNGIDFYQLQMKRPSMVESLLQVIVDSYQEIPFSKMHDGEVLLYCEKYLLINARYVSDCDPENTNLLFNLTYADLCNQFKN